MQHSPFTHRVTIVLEEAKAKHTFFRIDTSNKPAWFTGVVNPVGKVRRVSKPCSPVSTHLPP